MLNKPDFTLNTPNPNPTQVTDAEWWLWLRLHELEPHTQLGGIYANKSGFHNTGNANAQHWPGNYSIHDAVNARGPWWRTKASALDWTFPDAQNGNYATINRYTQRLMTSAHDPHDPRLDLIVYEFFGQSDTDSQVEGYDEYHEEAATSDSSHLWHIHMSFLRSKCGDFWGMWALLTVLMGWTATQWRASLPPTNQGETLMALTDPEQTELLTLTRRINTIIETGQRPEGNQTAGGGIPINWLVRQFAQLGTHDIDEQAIVQGVLAGLADLSPAGIADKVIDALPRDLAEQVVTVMSARLAAGTTPTAS